LLLKLRELKKDKLENKRDISGEYEDLKIKFALVKEMKEKIVLKSKSNDFNLLTLFFSNFLVFISSYSLKTMILGKPLANQLMSLWK
jgi:hypothetical protein